MSKNIIIQEGGLGKQLTADKLKTNLVGGGSCLWVPEDETALGTKYISENGTYRAANDGYYGYSEVTVSGVGTVTGKDPDTGEDVEVHKDPDTGEIVETVIPASISVTTPPSKTDYNDGETIDFTGMVVKAYKSSGDVWTDSTHPDGVIPHSELIFPVTTASASGTLPSHESDGSIVGTKIKSAGLSGKTITGQVEELDAQYNISPFNAVQVAIVNGTYVVASGSDFGQCWFNKTRLDGSGGQGFAIYPSQFTHDGKTVYYKTAGFPAHNIMENNFDVIPVNTVPSVPNEHSLAECAWEMIYTGESYGNQEIPVQWNKPYGAGLLETSFDITVTGGTP